MRTCSLDGCDRRHDARGYCSMHYRKLVRYGDVHYQPDPKFTTPAQDCKVDDCGRRSSGRGYCATHYKRVVRFGDPQAHIPIADGWAAPLDATPLLAALDAREVPTSRLDKSDEKAIRRARKSGRMMPHVADRLACKVLGVHPASVFGEAWWLAEEMEGAAA